MNESSCFIFLSILFCGYVCSVVGSNEFQESVVVLQRRAVGNGTNNVLIYWYHPKFVRGDKWVVYLNDSVTAKKGSGVFAEAGFMNSTQGSFATNIILEGQESIYKYCSTIIRNGNVIVKSTSCENKVNWMYDRKDKLQNFTIPELVIPGTHDSASYTSPHDSELWVKDLTSRWAITQQHSLADQLMDGIRFLDLRPARRTENGIPKWTLNHGPVWMMSFDKAIQEINEFLYSSNDVVIVSFKDFPQGFTNERVHQLFQKYVVEVFKEYAHPYSGWQTPLSSFWSSKKRLILSYDHEPAPTSDLFWPKIPQIWGNKQTVRGLHNFFSGVYKNFTRWNETRDPHAAMVELTHDVSTVGTDVLVEGAQQIPLFGGLLPDTDMDLRAWGDEVAPHIFKWFTESWRPYANVIACDFYQSPGVVDLAIQLNDDRATQK